MDVGAPNRAYAFRNFVLDVGEGLLLCNGQQVPLTPKALETLIVLLENSGHVCSKDELMKRVWPESFVEDNNLSQNISQLRKALETVGEKASDYIETVPRRGYRFKVPVIVTEGIAREPLVLREPANSRFPNTQVNQPKARWMSHSVGSGNLRETGNIQTEIGEAFPTELTSLPETRYARSGDVNIAYQVVGNGPLDLVFVMGWISHLEYFWRESNFSAFLRRLASFSRLILFDKRGTGLSDRVPLDELPTLEQRMDDVRAVLEAVGSKRAALCGVSEGGPMSALFAATYPERTAALIMIGTYAKRIWDPDYPWAPTAQQRAQFFAEMQQNWGGPIGIEERAPSKANDPKFRDWWATYLRMGASPGAAVALTKMNAEVDVRHVLPTIRVPVLVIHRAGDLCLKVEEGRYVASLIPGAKYVELPGNDHLPFVGDKVAILDEIEEFLTGARHHVEPERVLATVLFTHVVAPVRKGDHEEQNQTNMFERFRAYIKKELAWFRGRELYTGDDGPLATFDGPARAIRCACTIAEYASRLGIEVCTSLHTGECDLLGDNRVGGLTVGIGRQIRDHARAGEVLVSHTVKDLIAGSGIHFEERGEQIFEDIPGRWRLYKVECGSCD